MTSPKKPLGKQRVSRMAKSSGPGLPGSVQNWEILPVPWVARRDLAAIAICMAMLTQAVEARDSQFPLCREPDARFNIRSVVGWCFLAVGDDAGREVPFARAGFASTR